MFLSQFHYTIEHVQGTKNMLADGLSRRHYEKSHTTVDDKMAAYPCYPGIQAITRSQTRTKTNLPGQENEKSHNEVTIKQQTETPEVDKYEIREKNNDRNSHPHTPQNTTHQDPKHLGKSTHSSGPDYRQTSVDQRDKERLLSGDTRQPTSDLDNEVLISAQQSDQFCTDLIEFLETGKLPQDRTRRQRCISREFDYCMKDGILCQMWTPLVGGTGDMILRFVIPESLQESIISAVHHDQMSSHLGINRMIGLLRQRYIFPGMYRKVQTFLNKCDICQKMKVKTRPLKRLPELYDTAFQCFDRVHTDMIGPMNSTQLGYKYIGVVVDSTSGYVVAWPQRNLSADQFARQFLNKVAAIFGPPRRIVSDNAAYYRSDLWRQVAIQIGSKLTFVTPYSPSSNGLAENGVKRIMTTLRCMAHNKPTRWHEFLPAACYSLNNTIQSTHNLSPHSIVFGRNGRQPLDNSLFLQEDEKPLFQLIQDMHIYQQNALQTAIRCKELWDKQRLKTEPQDVNTSPLLPGTVVFWTKPGTKDGQGKFAARQFGPYIVLHASWFAARIKHLDTGKIHDLPVNISQLHVARDYQTPKDDKTRDVLLYAKEKPAEPTSTNNEEWIWNTTRSQQQQLNQTTVTKYPYSCLLTLPVSICDNSPWHNQEQYRD